jgi:signal transduction histidine kinase
MARFARHPWYFETDTAHDALAGRRLLELYLAEHCGSDSDIFGASVAFAELVSNVVKHAPGKGVRVWLEPQGQRFVLCVKDAGRGFTERDVPFPDDESESGRGLSMVRSFCGDLWYEARQGGFVVCVPLPVTRR